MDKLESFGQALSQVTMYDIKSMYNQAKNMVLNVSEMEAKVREATNDEPWGASSTLMQEIAAGTHNFQQFNEIMPSIYSRFMDKEARQWREIYKALQLLEYIIKHGSERVVDDTRSHLSTIKMLRNFHYIDEKGKDQGINVRNRAKELTELLMDVEKIRTERRKAKTNRNKYVGTGNDPMSFSGSRYGGFGSDSFASGRGYGGGGGYDGGYGSYGGGGSSSGGGNGFRDDRRYDEYNAGDDEITAPRRSNSLAASTGGAGGLSNRTATSAAGFGQTSTKAQEKVVDLLGFDDDDYSAPASAPASSMTTNISAVPTVAAGKTAEKALPSNPLDDGDDEFADFQAAPVSAPVSPAPSANPNANIFAALAQSSSPAAQTQMQAHRPMQSIGGFPAGGIGTARPASVASVPTMSAMSPISAMSPTANRTSFASPPPPASQPMSPTAFGTGMGMGVMSPISPSARPAAQTASSFSSVKSASGTPARPSSTSVGFDDLWSMSLGSKTANNNSSTSNAGAGGTKSIKDLEKEKAQASIWGGLSGGVQSPAGKTTTGTGANSMGMGVGGAFGASGSSAGAGGDDLLL